VGCLLALTLGATAVSAQRLDLPARPPDAPGGLELARVLEELEPERREARIVEEIMRGNVPGWLRILRPVDVVRVVAGSARTIRVLVAPDYLAVGSDFDYFIVPMSPRSAQHIADRTGTSLPTPVVVDAVWQAADVRLGPDSIPPGPEMTTVPVFALHDRRIRARRIRSGAAFGALVAGHKKDVVLSARLRDRPDHVAIYGWHRPDGRPIQPLYTGHTDDWVDYSHGIRLVHRTIWIDGVPAELPSLLQDPELALLLSDEGVVASPRYPTDGSAGLVEDHHPDIPPPHLDPTSVVDLQRDVPGRFADLVVDEVHHEGAVDPRPHTGPHHPHPHLVPLSHPQRSIQLRFGLDEPAPAVRLVDPSRVQTRRRDLGLPAGDDHAVQPGSEEHPAVAVRLLAELERQIEVTVGRVGP
jgi:hypothetical protein